MRLPALRRSREEVAPPSPLKKRAVARAARERAERRLARRRVAMRRLGVLAGVSALAFVVVVGVFPTRTWLDQRSDTAEASERLAVLRAQNDALSDRVERLQSEAEIERLAREQYNLVLPGEEAYAVLPPPLPALDLPPVFPYGELLPPATGSDAAPSAATP